MTEPLATKPTPTAPEDARGQARLLHFEDCRQAIDALFTQSQTVQPDGAFREYLRFIRKIPNLSVYNALLVRVQRPGASAVATRRRWREDYQREIKPDAIPIVILQLFGPVLFVYDIADTEGPEIPGADANPLFAQGPLDDKTYERVVQAAEANGFTVEASLQMGEQLAGTAAGWKTYPTPGASGKGYRIRLNARHDQPTRFATLAHELGHIYCGHLGGDAKGRWPDRRALRPETKELEAEAVSWLVAQRYGVTTRSDQYLNQWMQPDALAEVSLYAIFDAANRVEARSDAATGRKKAL